MVRFMFYKTGGRKWYPSHTRRCKRGTPRPSSINATSASGPFVRISAPKAHPVPSAAFCLLHFLHAFAAGLMRIEGHRRSGGRGHGPPTRESLLGTAPSTSVGQAGNGGRFHAQR